MNKPIYLSKSKFLSGWQCPLKLWYDIKRPELASETSDDLQAIFDLGHEIGRLAHGLYPGGRLIEENHLSHGKAVKSTSVAMADKDVPAVFEAAFEYDGIKIRADILVRTDNGWDLIEVKSSTDVKEVNLYDVALQRYVLKGAGVVINRACLCHINKEYVYDGARIEPRGFLVVEDITEKVLLLKDEVIAILADLRRALDSDEEPERQAPYRCKDPYPCQYYGHCTQDKDEYWVFNLPRLRMDKLKELEDRGIINIQDLPDDERLSDLQARVKDALLSGVEYLDPALKAELLDVEYPVYFLDFETFMPAIPRYKGTRPYQVLPFQWSCHIMDKAGKLTHKEYLCTEDKDPRVDFTETMLNLLGDSGTICMYHHYERDRINALAAELPQYDASLKRLIPRLWDILVTMRNNYYHPKFGKSFSLKCVLPALVDNMSYDDLEICDGGMASSSYEVMICSQTAPDEKKLIKNALLKYCEQDTLAMVKLRDVLLEK
ncbi:MAG: DUF2779 domain-containing protein [Nitrospirota bacterium]